MPKIPKRETPLKIALLRVIQQQAGQDFLPLLHQQVRGHGMPDMTLTGHKRTSWWEIKHATPDFVSPGIQEHTCALLAQNGFCRYIIYFETLTLQETWIVHPRYILGRHGKTAGLPTLEYVFNGHDHKGVLKYMLGVHPI